MTPDRLRAWILLSVPEKADDLSQIIGRADGLNKAIPTYSELADSLGWLLAANLVEGGPARYQTTAQGKALVARLQEDSDGAFQLWDKLTETLGGRHVGQYRVDGLTEQDVETAYARYHREFWQKYDELSASDSELPENVLAAIRANRKIDAIKLLRKHRGLGLKDAKNIVDAYVLKHPSQAVHESPKAESGTGRLVLGVILLAMGYAAYRLYLSS